MTIYGFKMLIEWSVSEFSKGNRTKASKLSRIAEKYKELDNDMFGIEREKTLMMRDSVIKALRLSREN